MVCVNGTFVAKGLLNKGKKLIFGFSVKLKQDNFSKIGHFQVDISQTWTHLPEPCLGSNESSRPELLRTVE